MSAHPFPHECVDDSECVGNRTDGTFVEGKCECGLNGISYCALFNGDPPYEDLFKKAVRLAS